jgi:tetratricopeptide (TPR) repeat protein
MNIRNPATDDDATVSMSYEEARKNLKDAANSRWPGIAAEFSGWIWPVIEKPSFKLTAADTIFTIGSCFARNVEEHVARLGCRVPMLELNLPPEEWRGPANSAMNKFNPPAFAQVLEWAGRIYDRDKRVTWDDCAPFALTSGDRFFDIDMGSTPPVTRERFVARRQHIFDIFSTVFTANCLMMTPGLIEAWRDKETGVYSHEAPVHKAMLPHASRFELEILSYEKCEAALLAAIDAVRSRNPAIKILVTTSPVPLSATFSGQDIRIANTYSKSILRAVCGALTLKRPMVDYFPSYESVMLSHPDDVWEQDRIHVSYRFVGRIVAHLLASYFEDADGSSELFQSAMAAISRSDNAAAADALTRTLQARPNFVQAQILLADTKVSLGRAAEAVPELRGLVEAMPQNPDVQLKLARALMHLDGKRPEAYGVITRAIAMDSITLVQFNHAQRMMRGAPLEVRERIARQGVERFPLHAAMYLELGEVLEQGGRRDEALEAFSRGAELHRPPPALQVSLARLLIENGRSAEALAHVLSARSRAPNDSEVVRLLALLQDNA